MAGKVEAMNAFIASIGFVGLKSLRIVPLDILKAGDKPWGA
jgi:hypothetical protein